MRFIGFRPTHPRAYRVYNFLFASVLFIIAFPVMVIISLALLATQGPVILYKGDRIGRHHSTFSILKFRTLNSEKAAQVTRDQTLPSDSNIFTPLGGFLRDTRLDELPQLINVIRGDMNICGPRPVREQIRQRYAHDIPGYDDRFEVRPGLLGPTQAYFGHGASKRLRAKMNSAAVRRPVSLLSELVFVFHVVFAMAVKLFVSLLPNSVATFFGLNGSPDITLVSGDTRESFVVEKINTKELTVRGQAPTDIPSELHIRMRSGGIRVAQVSLEPTVLPSTYRFETLNEYGAYVVERYALGKAVLAPPVSTATARSHSNAFVAAHHDA